MNIVILGGGIAGLLGAYAMRSQKPTIIEAAGKLGGNFNAGGLKYIHDTTEMRQLLTELELPFEPYIPQGRIHLDGHEATHPDTLAGLDELRRYQIQFRHWAKTRATSVGFRPDCMNDPLGNHAALRCDTQEMLVRIERKLRQAGCYIHLGANVQSIDLDCNRENGRRWVHFSEGMHQAAVAYDILIPTLPLGALSKLCPEADLPFSEATRLAIFEVAVPIFKRIDWDYMYTPEAKWISRLVQPRRQVVQAEIPWYLVQHDLIEQHNYTPERAKAVSTTDVIPEVLRILETTFGIEGVCTNARLIPGHLRPLDREAYWPFNWYPLGRFAQWDSRATADKVYARAMSVAQSIGA